MNCTIFSFKNILFSVLILLISVRCRPKEPDRLQNIKSPVIFKGDSVTAYRDPAVLYHNGTFHLFYTYVTIAPDKKVYSQIATSTSRDLVNWSTSRLLTHKDQKLNYSSPGNVVRFNGEWLLCLQSYPRPGYVSRLPVSYGDNTARIFILRSKNLKEWGEPELLKVKGIDVLPEQIGRMIDPYLIEDKDVKGKWWCFYKQNGVSMSYTFDFVNWTYFGKAEAGENVCVLVENNKYIMFHSPHNGIGVKSSSDLLTWDTQGDTITLGQDQWEWAKGRITAGTVTDLRNNPEFGKFIMFFHGSGPLTEKEGDFDRNSSIGIAWSNNLTNWSWAR